MSNAMNRINALSTPAILEPSMASTASTSAASVQRKNTRRERHRQKTVRRHAQRDRRAFETHTWSFSDQVMEETREQFKEHIAHVVRRLRRDEHVIFGDMPLREIIKNHSNRLYPTGDWTPVVLSNLHRK